MICVLNHYSLNIDATTKRIEETTKIPYKVFTDTTDYYKTKNEYRYKGLDDNFLNILAHKTDSPYKIVIHDDIRIHDNLFGNIEHVMQYAPGGMVGFYNPTNKQFLEAHERGHHVIKTPINYWTQCAVYNTEWGYEFVRWVKENMKNYDKTSEDGMLWHYHSITNSFAHIVIPSFVQHDGYDKSTFKIGAKVGKRLRNSATYDEAFDPKSVDWVKEFQNPYSDNRKRLMNHAV